MKRFSAGVVSWPLARRNSQLLPALALYRLLLSIRLGRCLPIFAMRHLLRWSLCARALCFRCVRFVDLRWCGS